MNKPIFTYFCRNQNPLKVTELGISGLLLIEPTVFGDPRGYFFESYSRKRFAESGIPVDFVQDNQSYSHNGALRGLHFQAPPWEQGKLVTVVTGAVLDVLVDIRRNSPTYGQHITVELNEENKRFLWIPPGFAHGFETLADKTIFQYKCTNYYNKESEGGIRWNDPDLKINWQGTSPIVSEKDQELPFFKQFNSPFN